MAEKRDATIAVIKVGGRQYVVRPGDHVRLPGAFGEKKTLQFPDLLSGKKVTVLMEGSGKSQKVSVRKFKSKVRYLRRRGYRENVTTAKIEKVGA